MKKILLLNMCLIFFASSFVYGQRRKNEKEDAEKAEILQEEALTPSASFNKNGIYDAQMDPTTRPLRVLPGVFIFPVETEVGAQNSLKEEVVTGFIKGVVVPDYIPDSTGRNIIAYSVVAELSGEENTAVRYLSFDENIMKLFEELAFNPEGRPNEIFMYGLKMDVKEASRIAGVSLASAGGETIETYLLTGVSLKKLERPALVLIASTLLRDVEEEVKKVYATNLGDAVRHVKISLLGYAEMKERNQIEENFLPYLVTKEFMVVRSIWTGESIKKGISGTSLFRDSHKKFPERVQPAAQNARRGGYVPD